MHYLCATRRMRNSVRMEKHFRLRLPEVSSAKPQAAIFKPIQFEHFNYANTLSQIID